MYYSKYVCTVFPAGDCCRTAYAIWRYLPVLLDRQPILPHTNGMDDAEISKRPSGVCKKRSRTDGSSENAIENAGKAVKT